MKVLIVCLCPATGVISDLFRDLAAALSPVVDLALLYPIGCPVPEDIQARRFRVSYSKKTPFSLLSRESLRLLKQLSVEQFDVVLFYNQHILNIPISAALGRAKHVMWWHEPNRKGRMPIIQNANYTAHDLVLTRKCSVIVVACRSMADSIPHRLSDKVRVIPIPYAGAFETRDGTHESSVEQSDILFFGRIERYKGLDLLAEALEIVYGQGIRPRLVVIGQGDMRHSCPKLLELERRHPQHVILHNSFMPYIFIVNAIRATKMVVLPYITAAGSVTVSGAYRYRKPIVATGIGCFQDSVQDGQTGLLVPGQNPIALAEAIKTLYLDPDYASHLGEQGFAYFQREMTMESILPKILSALAVA